MKARWPKDKKHPDRRGEWTTPKQIPLPLSEHDWVTQMDAYIGAMNFGPGGMLSVDYLSNDGETFRQQYLGQPRAGRVFFEGGRRAGRGGRLRQAAERLRSRELFCPTFSGIQVRTSELTPRDRIEFIAPLEPDTEIVADLRVQYHPLVPLSPRRLGVITDIGED